MPSPIKLWRVEVVCLVKSQEQIKVKEFRATESGARQMALMTKGAVRVHSVVEIQEVAELVTQSVSGK